MNSYLLATGDPSRSTLRLFSERSFPSPVHGRGARALSGARVRPPAAAHPAVRARAHTGAPMYGASPGSCRVPGRHGRWSYWISTPAGPLPHGTPASRDLDVPLVTSL